MFTNSQKRNMMFRRPLPNQSLAPRRPRWYQSPRYQKPWSRTARKSFSTRPDVVELIDGLAETELLHPPESTRHNSPGRENSMEWRNNQHSFSRGRGRGGYHGNWNPQQSHYQWNPQQHGDFNKENSYSRDVRNERRIDPRNDPNSVDFYLYRGERYDRTKSNSAGRSDRRSPGYYDRQRSPDSRRHSRSPPKRRRSPHFTDHRIPRNDRNREGREQFSERSSSSRSPVKHSSRTPPHKNKRKHDRWSRSRSSSRDHKHCKRHKRVHSKTGSTDPISSDSSPEKIKTKDKLTSTKRGDLLELVHASELSSVSSQELFENSQRSEEADSDHGETENLSEEKGKTIENTNTEHVGDGDRMSGSDEVVKEFFVRANKSLSPSKDKRTDGKTTIEEKSNASVEDKQDSKCNDKAKHDIKQLRETLLESQKTVDPKMKTLLNNLLTSKYFKDDEAPGNVTKTKDDCKFMPEKSELKKTELCDTKPERCSAKMKLNMKPRVVIDRCDRMMREMLKKNTGSDSVKSNDKSLSTNKDSVSSKDMPVEFTNAEHLAVDRKHKPSKESFGSDDLIKSPSIIHSADDRKNNQQMESSVTEENKKHRQPMENAVIDENKKHKQSMENVVIDEKRKHKQPMEKDLTDEKRKHNQPMENAVTDENRKHKQPMENALTDENRKHKHPMEKALTDEKRKHKQVMENAVTDEKRKHKQPMESDITDENRKHKHPLEKALTDEKRKHKHVIENAVTDDNRKHKQPMESDITNENRKHTHPLEKALTDEKRKHKQVIENAVTDDNRKHKHPMEKALTDEKRKHKQVMENAVTDEKRKHKQSMENAVTDENRKLKQPLENSVTNDNRKRRLSNENSVSDDKSKHRMPMFNSVMDNNRKRRLSMENSFADDSVEMSSNAKSQSIKKNSADYRKNNQPMENTVSEKSVKSPKAKSPSIVKGNLCRPSFGEYIALGKSSAEKKKCVSPAQEDSCSTSPLFGKNKRRISHFGITSKQPDKKISLSPLKKRKELKTGRIIKLHPFKHLTPKVSKTNLLKSLKRDTVSSATTHVSEGKNRPMNLEQTRNQDRTANVTEKSDRTGILSNSINKHADHSKDKSKVEQAKKPDMKEKVKESHRPAGNKDLHKQTVTDTSEKSKKHKDKCESPISEKTENNRSSKKVLSKSNHQDLKKNKVHGEYKPHLTTVDGKDEKFASKETTDPTHKHAEIHAAKTNHRRKSNDSDNIFEKMGIQKADKNEKKEAKSDNPDKHKVRHDSSNNLSNILRKEKSADEKEVKSNNSDKHKVRHDKSKDLSNILRKEKTPEPEKTKMSEKNRVIHNEKSKSKETTNSCEQNGETDSKQIKDKLTLDHSNENTNSQNSQMNSDKRRCIPDTEVINKKGKKAIEENKVAERKSSVDKRSSADNSGSVDTSSSADKRCVEDESGSVVKMAKASEPPKMSGVVRGIHTQLPACVPTYKKKLFKSGEKETSDQKFEDGNSNNETSLDKNKSNESVNKTHQSSPNSQNVNAEIEMPSPEPDDILVATPLTKQRDTETVENMSGPKLIEKPSELLPDASKEKDLNLEDADIVESKCNAEHDNASSTVSKPETEPPTEIPSEEEHFVTKDDDNMSDDEDDIMPIEMIGSMFIDEKDLDGEEIEQNECIESKNKENKLLESMGQNEILLKVKFCDDLMVIKNPIQHKVEDKKEIEKVESSITEVVNDTKENQQSDMINNVDTCKIKLDLNNDAGNVEIKRTANQDCDHLNTEEERNVAEEIRETNDIKSNLDNAVNDLDETLIQEDNETNCPSKGESKSVHKTPRKRFSDTLSGLSKLLNEQTQSERVLKRKAKKSKKKLVEVEKPINDEDTDDVDEELLSSGIELTPSKHSPESNWLQRAKAKTIKLPKAVNEQEKLTEKQQSDSSEVASNPDIPVNAEDSDVLPAFDKTLNKEVENVAAKTDTISSVVVLGQDTSEMSTVEPAADDSNVCPGTSPYTSINDETIIADNADDVESQPHKAPSVLAEEEVYDLSVFNKEIEVAHKKYLKNDYTTETAAFLTPKRLFKTSLNEGRNMGKCLRCSSCSMYFSPLAFTLHHDTQSLNDLIDPVKSNKAEYRLKDRPSKAVANIFKHFVEYFHSEREKRCKSGPIVLPRIKTPTPDVPPTVDASTVDQRNNSSQQANSTPAKCITVAAIWVPEIVAQSVKTAQTGTVIRPQDNPIQPAQTTIKHTVSSILAEKLTSEESQAEVSTTKPAVITANKVPENVVTNPRLETVSSTSDSNRPAVRRHHGCRRKSGPAQFTTNTVGSVPMFNPLTAPLMRPANPIQRSNSVNQWMIDNANSFGSQSVVPPVYNSGTNSGNIPGNYRTRNLSGSGQVDYRSRGYEENVPFDFQVRNENQMGGYTPTYGVGSTNNMTYPSVPSQAGGSHYSQQSSHMVNNSYPVNQDRGVYQPNQSNVTPNAFQFNNNTQSFQQATNNFPPRNLPPPYPSSNPVTVGHAVNPASTSMSGIPSTPSDRLLMSEEYQSAAVSHSIRAPPYIQPERRQDKTLHQTSQSSFLDRQNSNSSLNHVPEQNVGMSISAVSSPEPCPTSGVTPGTSSSVSSCINTGPTYNNLIADVDKEERTRQLLEELCELHNIKSSDDGLNILLLSDMLKVRGLISVNKEVLKMSKQKMSSASQSAALSAGSYSDEGRINRIIDMKKSANQNP